MANKNRGSNTHGAGSSKKRRGAGSRGGRGKAGRGKKAAHEKKKYTKDGKYLGRKGFNRPKSVTSEKTGINLREIDQKIETFVEAGLAEETGDGYVFDAAEAGFDKVLGKGRLTQDIDIKAESFSASAREKIEDNGNEALEHE